MHVCKGLFMTVFFYTPECFSLSGIGDKRLYLSLVKGISLSLSLSLSSSSETSQPFLNNVNESCQSTPLWSATKVKGSVKTLKCWFSWGWWLPFAPLKKKKKYSWSEVLCALESCEGCLSPSLSPPPPQLSEMSKLNMKFRLALTASKVGAFFFFSPSP